MLGNFQLVGIPPAPKGIPQVEVTFDIDADGIVNVSAKDKATNKDQSITIAASSGLSDKEIESMIEQAEAHAEADKARRDLIEAANASESVAAETEKALKEFKEQIDAEEAKQVEKLVGELRELGIKAQSEGATITADELKAKRDEVQNASLNRTFPHFLYLFRSSSLTLTLCPPSLVFKKVYEKRNSDSQAAPEQPASDSTEPPKKD